MKRFPFRFWLVVWVVACLSACSSLPPQVSPELGSLPGGQPDAYAARPEAAQMRTDWQTAAALHGKAPAESELRTGQLLVWANRGAIGLFVGLFAQDFRPWSHIGIISVEKDGVFVYDTDAAFITFSDAPPTDAYAGGMRRIRLKDHIATHYIFGIYNPPANVHVEKMVAFAQEQFRRGTRFDAYFDNLDHRELYCSEMVAMAYEAGGATEPRLSPVRANRSYDVIRQWLKIHPTGFYLPGDLISADRRVAVWSNDLTPQQIEAFFAAQQELVDRFGPTTQLGQLMQWNPMSLSLLAALSLRASAQGFLDVSLAAAAHDASAESDSTAIRRQVRSLADRYFVQPSDMHSASR